MSVNYDRVCRLCLSSRGELLPIFPTTSSDDSEPPVLASKIKDCVAIQITENDELPTKVCRKCMDNVHNWHIFKSVCERTQNKLQSLIKKDGNQLDEVKIKSEPLTDEAYDDGVVIDGSYPDTENIHSSSKTQPEGPPILASLGLTPRSDKNSKSYQAVMEHCASCSFPIQADNLHYYFWDLGPEILSAIEQEFEPEVLAEYMEENSELCENCFNKVVRDFTVQKSGSNSLVDNPFVPQPYKTNICVWCKSSLYSRRTCAIRGPIRNFVRDKIYPRKIPQAGLLCYACWVNARRFLKTENASAAESDLPAEEEQANYNNQCLCCLRSLATRRRKSLPEGPERDEIAARIRPRQGVDSEKDEEEDEDEEDVQGHNQRSSTTNKVASMPEVSITVMRPTGETLQARSGFIALASKDCLVCGRTYRYSHNARRHELTAHSFDRYTNKVIKKPKPQPTLSQMRPKLRPNPFNPKARLMPNPISQKMQLLPKAMPAKMIPQKVIAPTLKPMPIKPTKSAQNNLPYPLRIKALKDLQIKKKEPQILKTLLTSKPEVLVSEPELINSAPESPETLISEPEIASFQVETILAEPDDQNQEDEVDGDMHSNRHQTYDTLDMESDNEIEIARQKDADKDNTGKENIADHDEENMEHDSVDNLDDSRHAEDEGESPEAENDEAKDEEQARDDDEAKEGYEVNDEHDEPADIVNQEENEEAEVSPLAPVVEINEELQNTNSFNSEINDEELDESVDPNDTVDGDQVKELDPDKHYVTQAQRDFIDKYRNIIQQVNTKRCLCCDKEYPRRKAVIQHLQKNGHKVPKHTCYNCVVTFSHIGALLSHMRSNTCTDLWKIIYDENGITDDMVVEDGGPKKPAYKDILNARSYACKLCPAKFQTKQFIMKHVLDIHEDGQSRVPLTCVHCGTRFKERAHMKKHIRNGNCTVYIACEMCSEQFSNTQEFNDHALAEHADNLDPDNQSKCIDGRMTDCPICAKKCTTYMCLVKHMKHEHGEERPHYCRHCDAKFEQTSDLDKHIYMTHSAVAVESAQPDMSIVKEEVEEYHYSCTECNAIFETVDAWTDHQVAEHNQVAHYCDQCDKKFLRPSELAEHKNTHLRVKFYPCSVCSNSYSTPQKLSEHVQQAHPGAGATAAADSEFYCHICIRSFKSRQAYSNHMRIHAKVPTTNRKPTDPKGFSPQIIRKQPIKQFNMASSGLVFKPNPNVPNAPYSCDICGKGFMHKKNIWKHKKVLHADLLNERNDSEENTMHASTEEDDYNVDENGAILSTPQFNSFNFADLNNEVQQQLSQGEVYTCNICHQRFAFKDSLRKHKLSKHHNSSAPETQTQSAGEGGGGRSNCTICKISFTDKKSYYRHRKNVHKSTTQMCKICGKPLNSTLELYEHLKAAHARELLGYNANQGSSKSQDNSQEMDPDYEVEQEAEPAGVDFMARYPCDTCGKQFVGLLALQNHQCINQIPTQPQTFDCEICHKSYTSIAALKSHRGWHLRSPDGKAAANNTGLWMPQNKVTSKVSKYEVLDAPVRTPSTTSKRRLPPEVEVTVVNPNKKLRSDDSIDMDQQTTTGLDGRYCSICDKEFTKRAAYQRHMDEVHQPNSVFCPVCDRSFTRKSTLLVHMKKHYEDGEGSTSAANQMEEDVYGCDVCGSQYNNEQALQAHRIREHGEESEQESEDEGQESILPHSNVGEFTCAQCGDGVATPRDLIAHRTMHATPTKYFCNICKVYFSKSLDLASHTRSRHSESDKSAMFPCAMCDRFYMNKKSLQRHIDMAH